jgi:hypothetical protein
MIFARSALPLKHLQDFVCWNNISNQIPDQPPLRQRFNGDSIGGQFNDASVLDLAVHRSHASFAGIGVNADVTNR